MTNNTIIIEELRGIFTTPLESFVMDDVLKQENVYDYLKGVTEYGCVSGMVSSLIYYNDTEKFHDDHENEIDELLSETIDSSGLSFSEIASSIDIWDIGQLKNWKAWFAYEEVAHRMLLEIEEIENEIIEQLN